MGLSALSRLGAVQANVVYCHGNITGGFGVFFVVAHATAVTSNMYSCRRS